MAYKDPVKRKEYCKQYYIQNKDKIKELQNKWNLANREKKAEIDKKWKLDNPKRKKEIDKKWRQNNPEKVAECSKRWESANRIYRNEYKRLIRENNPKARHKHNIRAATVNKYGPAPKGKERHHTTDPYTVDDWVMVTKEEHIRIHFGGKNK